MVVVGKAVGDVVTEGVDPTTGGLTPLVMCFTGSELAFGVGVRDEMIVSVDLRFWLTSA